MTLKTHICFPFLLLPPFAPLPHFHFQSNARWQATRSVDPLVGAGAGADAAGLTVKLGRLTRGLLLDRSWWWNITQGQNK